MAGLGRKTFSPGDVLTSSDVQGYLMDQSVMVFAGTAARASAIPSPSAGMVAYSTATALQVYNGSAWVDASTGYGSASGTAASSTAITVSAVNYTLLTFTADSSLVVGKAGLFDIVMVAGGGGGGSANNLGGGGGAGGVVQSTIYLPATTYQITVGAGGTGTVTREMSGFGRGSEIAGVLTAAGGGSVNYNLADGMAGGSGGGGASGVVGTAGPAIAGSQGKNGGIQATTAAGGGGGPFKQFCQWGQRDRRKSLVDAADRRIEAPPDHRFIYQPDRGRHGRGRAGRRHLL